MAQLATPERDTAATTTSKYRPDVDGLRAIAVIAVIINHFNKNLLPSGYLGVDIFFVISGFVITTSLGRHSAKGFSDFILGFYARRLRRILPALLVMVLVSSVLISLFDPNPGTSLITGITAIFGFSNVYLVTRLTDYFAASAELNIFLHTWSLGIEEQFYFLFPLLAWWSGLGRGSPRGPRRLALLLIPLLLISLISFVILYPRSQPHAYFLITSRFWELASGCLISLVAQRQASLPFRLPPLPLLGALIGTLFFPLDQAVSATILCIVLTSFLILSVHPGSAAHRLLSWRKLVFIGLLSYSLYLWHWPVLALSRWTVGIHPETIPFQLLLVFLLAWLSYRYVESPLRHASWPPTRAGTILFSLLVSLASSLFMIGMAKAWQENLFLGQKNELENKFTSLSQPTHPICNLFDDSNASTYFPEKCGKKASPGRPTIYVLGDSQIEQFAKPISAFANQHNFGFHGLWGNACAFPALSGVKGHDRAISEECQKAQRIAAKTLQSAVKPGDIVFIGSYLTTYFSKETKAVSGTLESARAAYLQRLIDVAESLVSRGATVVLYLNGPRFDGLQGAIEGYCFPQWFKTKPDPSCRFPTQPYLQTRLIEYKQLKDWADGSQRIVWDGVDSSTCGLENCQATHYKDEAHFRDYYANYLFSKLVQRYPQLSPAL